MFGAILLTNITPICCAVSMRLQPNANYSIQTPPASQTTAGSMRHQLHTSSDSIRTSVIMQSFQDDESSDPDTARVSREVSPLRDNNS